MLASVTLGVSAIVGEILSVISDMIADPTILSLVGLAIGFVIVRYAINIIPMFRRNR